MTNQRFSWSAVALALAMSLAGMLVAVQALAQSPATLAKRQADGRVLADTTRHAPEMSRRVEVFVIKADGRLAAGERAPIE
jgi:hypothetical protein